MQKTDNEIFDYLREKVAGETPFCLLRYGDGEGLFAFSPKGLHRRYSASCIKHWGEVPPGIYRMQILKNIRNSYRQCDVAGLPYGFEKINFRLALNNFLRLDPKEMLCSANIHIALTQSGVLDELILNRHIFYLGCRDIDEFLVEKGAMSIGHIFISGQHKFETKKPKLPFYRQVNSIEKELKEMDLTGVLCLMGAGVAGKHLGLIMKERGGMVIDVGSVFDMWAGKRTRGWIPETTECKS